MGYFEGFRIPLMQHTKLGGKRVTSSYSGGRRAKKKGDTAPDAQGDDKIAKISLVGVGMRSHAGVASKMFETLAAESVNIEMISTSEIKISVVVAEKYLELAVRALHSAFELDKTE